MILQIAKHLGLETIVSVSTDKQDYVRGQGADHVIDYTQGDFSKDGKTYDVIFDVVGKLSHSKALRLLKKKGYYVSAIPLMNRIFINMFSNIFSTKTTATGLTSATPEDLQHMCDLLKAGHIKTVIDKVYPLEEIVEAEKYIEAEERKGNVVLRIGDY